MAKKDSSSGPLSLSPPQQSAGGFLDAYQQAAGSPLNMACSGLPAGFTGYSAAGLPDPAGELPTALQACPAQLLSARILGLGLGGQDQLGSSCVSLRRILPWGPLTGYSLV